MCGIAGWVSFERDLTTERPALDAMTETMLCRGPDASGVWLSRHAGLGHRRLSIIDLEGGRQPMVVDTPAGPVALTYSGEAYNFTELRSELRSRGHEFRTDSDTEVVLRGYLEWGEGLAERLNGMYAFAIWDGREEKLVLMRDRMGIKPLYHYPTPDGVLFGSEPKAILANPLAEPVVDADGLRELFSFSKTPGHAIYAGMREVLPGTVVTVDRNGLRERVYWRLEAIEHRDDVPTTVARVRELLDDIVRRQLVADVPRCVLLSGGLDSSAITALAGRQLAEQGEKVRSFAVDFVGQTENFRPDELRGTPDAPFVRDVAQHVGSDHRDIVLDHSTLADPEVRRATVAARDFPIGFGDIDYSLLLLFRAIREHSTVALSGESADEVFGGYKWFHDPAVQKAEMFPWIATALSSQLRPNALLSPELTATLDLGTYVRDRYAEALAEVPVLDGEDEHERRMREICYLHLTRFVRMLLDRKDRMSMAVGLEVRVPFCDHRLVQYVFNTPWSMKTFDGREKSLLRAAAQDVLPRSVVERVKSPYPSTQDVQYLVDLQHQVQDLLAGDSPALDLVDREAVLELARRDPEKVVAGERSRLERLLDVATWLEIRRPVLKLS
ncbi:asparagine synthase (glutamine-hydrolyzing) [Streptoalloteichus tenebrarius]|uniref:asparagine synthase (glutamine-hydrolyzing) n=1 Tax=Streptoalloteichus tenebrarius (strain ATCC 17920 / DSM 40477 / JCM 4838 / CBS 697.72 / NBRC 16177 / NCIMB 11028 / NRRL B-12390 / A12253. 1 / ISP 5477) TaxID=1933 RepID=A0ABT1HZF4_STRSD|nr:asparagine synthase (glutamine-hydrolyzing) [Streptoalloteichus tenebrarius]MCP2260905.1 asparagine synthase (glutamine-hydrolyzing) [Streptoalloteichus tenebrarius]BFF03334.1 asparagine synthase (glutamine-hydrolyzing) [Streptoalloteichus tenebrarius]